MTLRGRKLEYSIIGSVILIWMFVVFPPVVRANIYGGTQTNVIFEDDFSGGALTSRWAHIEPTNDERSDVLWPAADGYRMRSANVLFALAPSPENIDDVSVSAGVTDAGNYLDEYASWGIICRVDPSTSNQYYFGILRDRRPFIAKQVHDRSTILKLGSSMDASDGPENRVRADCVGPTLTMYVDGRRILETEDGQLTSGAVGLRVESADVMFANFRVTQPQ